jgi:hypothetical protein
MLGIIHRDKANGTVISNWLKKIRPDVVTLEFSPYGFMFRKIRGLFYKKKIESILTQIRHNGQTYNEEALSFLNAYINLPAEYETASLYCRENNASLHLIDMDLYSYINLKNADELFSEENIKRIAASQSNPASGNERVMARLFFDSGIETIPYTDEMCIRDRYMARRIGTLLQSQKELRITHITGWQHLKDPYGIFSPYHPVKVFAYD